MTDVNSSFNKHLHQISQKNQLNSKWQMLNSNSKINQQ
jgi:hypothetical protein